MKAMKNFIVFCLALMAMAAPAFSGGRREAAAPSGGSGADRRYRFEWYSNYMVDPDGAIVKLMEEKFNVDFNMLEPGEGLAVRLAAGEIPDVFQSMVGDYRKYVNDGLVAEIPWDTIRIHAPKLYAAYTAELGDRDLRRSEIDGKNYGLDVLDAETGGVRPLIVYRGDWIERVGAKVPETLTEFEDLMYKFTRNDPDGNGRNDTYGLSASMMDAVYGAYGYLPNSWAEKNGQLVYGGIQPEMKDALTLLAKWYRDGALHPEWVTGEHTSGHWSISNQFVDGQIGVSSHGQYIHWKPRPREGEREGGNITELRAANPGAVEKLVYGRPPAGPGGKRGINLNSPLHTRFIVFGAQLADDPDKMIRALRILDYAIADEEGFMLTRFGVEGTHWQKDSDGIPLAIGDYSVWAQISSVGGGIVFTFGSWLKPFMGRINTDFAWGQTLPGLTEDGIANALFLPPPSSVEYNTELNKIREEAYTDIITGRQPLGYFDTFVSEWRRSGGDILTREANR
jgi:putative aldouronate transport system substrate-binding protein